MSYDALVSYDALGKFEEHDASFALSKMSAYTISRK